MFYTKEFKGGSKISIEDLLIVASKYQWALLIFFISVPIIALFLTGVKKDDFVLLKPSTKLVLSVLIYLSCIPGIFSTMLVAYSLFFIGANLLKANVIIYFIPIISMIATLVIINRKVSFSEIPGFDKLSALISIIAIVFLILFILYRLRIFIMFRSSALIFLGIGIALFFGVKIAWKKLFKKRE